MSVDGKYFIIYPIKLHLWCYVYTQKLLLTLNILGTARRFSGSFRYLINKDNFSVRKHNLIFMLLHNVLSDELLQTKYFMEYYRVRVCVIDFHIRTTVIRQTKPCSMVL